MAMAMPETESVAASSSRMPEGTIDPAIGTEIRDHLSREPAGAGHHVALAQAALQAGRPERAKAPLLRALAILPHEASLHANLAILSPAAPARRAMKRAVALAPDVFPFHANLAAMAIFPAERRVLHGRRALAILPGTTGSPSSGIHSTRPVLRFQPTVPRAISAPAYVRDCPTERGPRYVREDCAGLTD